MSWRALSIVGLVATLLQNVLVVYAIYSGAPAWAVAIIAFCFLLTFSATLYARMVGGAP